ncbi:protein O-mannosyl-transferase TMTC4 isoform X2 [Stegastes partitus]|uniref:dolichyl-phosphate-mannose--protein mannosyltransferase n=1 Tax=Stegastes partitus TaxID=144197 RepID=A0A3B4ZNI9_9TELE|nr:PREDICTED: transmembrane and TPR repeat-containing protein 4 isoform X2 [Stegastes partitus]
MALTEVYWDHHIPLPKLAPIQAKVTVALVALLCFINSYDGEFVFDDSEAIVNNKDLRPTTPLNNIWSNDFWGSNLSSNSSHKSYRPLTVLTFRLNYLVAGGLHPVGFHVLNILLHAVISALMIDVFAILIGGLAYDEKGRILNHAPKTSLLAAVFFAAHPVHTESGVNAAFDVLLICNVNVYELSQRLLLRKNPLDISEIFRMGLLTRLTLMGLGGLLMLYARWRIMGTGPPAFTEVDNPASFAENIFLRIVNYNYYYSLNAWLLLCPWWLCFDWSMGCVPLIKSATDWRMVWLLLLWCILIGLISQALCSQDSQRRRTLTLGLVLLVVPFLPACNIFFRVGFVIAERVLYLSSAGYCLLLAYSLGHCFCCWSKHRRLLCVMVLALLCVYVVRCALRSHQWRSEQSLFSSALTVCPLNAKVHYNVGKNLADKGNTSAAVSYYREAVRLHPTYVHAMNNLGNILKEKNELVEAEQLLSKAVSIQPDFAAAWMNLGIVQNSLQKFEKAEQSYWNAIRFRRKYPDCYYNLGRLYADQNRHVDALNAWRNATVLKPDHSLAWNNMVILLDNTGNLGQAELIGREALRLLPNDHTIMFSLANVLGKLQKYKESEGFFLHALRINPNAASCHGNLAVLYHRWGKLELAKKHYELSLKLDPEAPGTRDNYNMLRRKLDQLKRSTP